MSAADKILEHVRRLVFPEDSAGQTDGRLLACFIETRDETAFEALMRRHGPMVMGVCRRFLGDGQDAEDAFQATFMVLVHKATSVRPRDMVGNWLYGVARQTALRVRALNARRGERERQMATMPDSQAAPAHSHEELYRLLDQELSRLPDKYRAAIILCDIEGKSRKEAARQLGWPEGSLSGRLARGRLLLAERMAKHGRELSAGVLATVLASDAASASLPAPLVSSTVRAAGILSAGQSGAVLPISARVAVIIDGVLKTMLLTKLKTMMSICLLVCLIGVGLSAGLSGGQPQEQTPQETPPIERTIVKGLEKPPEARPQRAKTDPNQLFYVLPVTTDLQRSGLETGSYKNFNRNLRGLVLIDGEGLLDGAESVRWNLLDFDALKKAIEPLRTKDSIMTVTVHYKASDRTNAKRLLRWALTGFVREPDGLYQRAPGIAESFDGVFDWAKHLERIDERFAAVDTDEDEPYTFDEVVSVVPVRTGLSRYLFGADCVVTVGRPLEADADTLSAEVEKTIRQRLDALKLPSKERVQFRIYHKGSHETIDRFVSVTSTELAKSLGFKDRGVTITPVAR